MLRYIHILANLKVYLILSFFETFVLNSMLELKSPTLRTYNRTFEMKLTSVIILLMLNVIAIPALVHAQSYTIDTAQRSMDVSGDFKGAELHLPAVKKIPEFPGGKKAWHDFLRSEIDIKVPFANRAVPRTYQVIIWFIVDSNGKVKRIGADSGCGYGMETEVIRCIKKTTDWIPAETSTGKKVSYTLRTLVKFTVTSNNVVVSL